MIDRNPHRDMFAIERDVVNRFLGIPYRHLGRSDGGIDCWGLLLALYAEIGISVPDPEKNYSENLRAGEDFFTRHAHDPWIPVVSPHMFDVVLFCNAKRIPNHCGIMLLQNRFIHGSRAGVVVAKINQWHKKVVGFYRHRELCP